LIFGFRFGVIFAVCMIPFMRTKRTALSFDNRTNFEQRLMVEMAELMYTPTVINSNLIHYDAPKTGVLEVGPFNSMSAAHLNRIAVHLTATNATFIGPRWMVNKVLAKLTNSQAPPPPMHSDSQPLTPPTGSGGWYPDPALRFEVRFWNGQRWTEYVMSTTAPP
jgi:uncharacterized protein DUF2510